MALNLPHRMFRNFAKSCIFVDNKKKGVTKLDFELKVLIAKIKEVFKQVVLLLC